ncbi:hypothetical protein [Streptomyces sp. SID3343]|uniref:hypothetical protein n=1 Tax=Streptomyces sp. SID3343 TaxID=2690260 RepID=UPI00136A6E78|nr:hypothetical protein [Streptomyces sp. SID3343]
MNHAGIEWISAATEDPVDTRCKWIREPFSPTLVGAGGLFDAVVMHADVGCAVLGILAARHQPVGAVISKAYSNRWAFFIGPGSRRAWRATVETEGLVRPSWYRYVGRDAWLTVPGPYPVLGGEAFLRWQVPPGTGTNLTCVTALGAAFVGATAADCSHPPEAVRAQDGVGTCPRCGEPRMSAD